MTRRPGLITRLVGATVVVGLVSVVVGVVLVRSSAGAALEGEALRRNAEVARRMAAMLDDRVGGIIDAMRYIARSKDVAALSPDAAGDLRVAVATTLPVMQLALYDGRGTPVAAAASARSLTAENAVGRPDLAESLRSGSWVARPFVADGRASLELAVGVEDPPGTRVGALVGVASMEDIASRIVALRLGPTGRAAVIDGMGAYLAHPERDRVVGGSTFEGPVADVAFRDGETFTTMATTESFSGAVLIQQGERDALASLGATMLRLTAIMIGVVAAIVVAVVVVARATLRRLGPLVDGVRRVARGDPGVRVEERGSGEVAELTFAFNQMSDALATRMAELRASEERFRRGFEDAPIGMVILGLDGRFQKVNRAFGEMLGCGATDLVGRSFLEITHPDDRDEGVTALRALVRGEMTTGVTEERYLTAGGGVVWGMLSVVALTDATGAPTSIYGQIRDITDRKQQVEALRRSERMYAEAYRREREAARRLRQLDEMKNTFLTAVSHELRTPLTSIIGFAETLNRADLELSSEDAKLFLHRVAVNARRLDGLLTDLLDLDRLTRGITAPRRRSIDVGSLVRRVVDSSDALAGRLPFVDAAKVRACVDPAMTERVVENLLANAVKHTPEGTPIWVRAASIGGDGVEIRVEDAGPGIPSDLQETVFRPFDRGSNADAPSPGAGIGLSLVARFAEIHGGRAWVATRPGGGASFRVLLPGPAGASTDATAAHTVLSP